MDQALTISKIAPELLVDFQAFFDRDAFSDNPDWASCYCNFYLADHREKPWEKRTANENRAAVSRRICEGQMHGYLAYLDGKPIGWCHAAPKMELPNIREDPDHAAPSPEQTGAIVCFVIARPYRRSGIAQRLLEAACDGFRDAGMHYAEAYPRPAADNDSANYHGPLQMFLSSGFDVFREIDGMVIVRKRLTD